jgi:hypothetical protein
VRGLLLAFVLAAGLLPGCAATRRGGENALVVATFPVHAVTTPFGYLRDDFQADPGHALGTLPFIFPLYLAGDIWFTGVAAVDAALTPFYTPFDVEPLGHYRVDTFPPRLKRKSLDAAADFAAGVVGVGSPFVGCFLGATGRADWSGNIAWPSSGFDRPRRP